MYSAIVSLPLLGAIIAALIALAGARARHPGGPPDVVADNHAHGPVAESHPRGALASYGAHAVLDTSRAEPQALEPPPPRPRSAHPLTPAFLFPPLLLS